MESQTIVTGDWRHPDFSAVLPAASDQIEYCAIDAEPKMLDPAFVVLAQSHREQFSSEHAERWRRLFPKATCIHLLGSWCEGEMRSGSTLADWRRVYWHRWPTEWQRLTENVNHSAENVTVRPSMTAAEFIAADIEHRPGGRCLHVAVVGRHRCDSSMVVDVLQLFGHHVSGPYASSRDALESESRLDAVCVAGDSLDAWLYQQAELAISGRRKLSVVAIMNFPRAHELRKLQTLARRRVHVVSRPFDVSQLQRTLMAVG